MHPQASQNIIEVLLMTTPPHFIFYFLFLLKINKKWVICPRLLTTFNLILFQLADTKGNTADPNQTFIMPKWVNN